MLVERYLRIYKVAMEFKNSRYILQLSWRSIVVNLENKTNQEHNLINHKMAPKPV